MKKIMILGAGILQVPAICKAKELGYHVIAVDYDENAVGFQYADTRLLVSTLDQEEVYRQALKLKPEIIITSTSDAPVMTVAYINQKLGRELDISLEDALCATNKAFMRQRLKEHNLPIPRFYIIEDINEYWAAVSRFEKRCIVKPADNAGSRGVILIDKNEDVSIDDLYFYSKKYSRSGTVLVEEFLEGPEVSVESFTVNGLTYVIAITDKLLTPPPFFVEIGHSEQSMLDEKIKAEIREITKKAVKAINIVNGPSHTEIKITKEGPKIIELAARLGGDFITSRLVLLSTGVDMVGNSLLQAIKEPIDLTIKFARGSAIRFIFSKSGIIKSIKGTEKAKAIVGIEEVDIYKKIGDKVHGLESSNDRIGHIIASAGTPEQAIAICEKARELIQIEVAPISGCKG